MKCISLCFTLECKFLFCGRSGGRGATVSAPEYFGYHDKRRSEGVVMVINFIK